MNKFFSFISARKSLLCVLGLFVTLLLVMAFFYKDQFFLGMYKVCLALVGLCIGAMFDMALFPYAKPRGYLAGKWDTDIKENRTDSADFPILVGQEMAFFIACIRRMLFSLIVMLGVCLAL